MVEGPEIGYPPLTIPECPSWAAPAPLTTGSKTPNVVPTTWGEMNCRRLPAGESEIDSSQ